MDMKTANATYEIISSTSAIVTTTYSYGGFGMGRVDVRYPADLINACHTRAVHHAFGQGETLGSFTKEGT